MDLHASANQVEGTTTVSVSMHLGGKVTVANGVINGSESLSAQVSATGNGQSASGTVSIDIAYNQLTYDAVQGCVTSGSLMIGATVDSSQGSQSRAVRFTFQGCHMVLVAIGS
jgi:hypothetical protein